MQLEWEGLSYTVPVGRGRGRAVKTVLDSISGSAAPGQLLAVMGPTGERGGSVRCCCCCRRCRCRHRRARRLAPSVAARLAPAAAPIAGSHRVTRPQSLPLHQAPERRACSTHWLGGCPPAGGWRALCWWLESRGARSSGACRRSCCRRAWGRGTGEAVPCASNLQGPRIAWPINILPVSGAPPLHLCTPHPPSNLA